MTSLRWMPLAAILGATGGMSMTFLDLRTGYGLVLLSFLVIGLSLVLNSVLFRRFLHLFGVVLCWLQVTHHCGANLHDEGYCIYGYEKDPQVPHAVNMVAFICYWLMTFVAFCVMEVDRINSITAMSESEELRQGYQGRVSACSGTSAPPKMTRKQFGDLYMHLYSYIELYITIVGSSFV